MFTYENFHGSLSLLTTSTTKIPLAWYVRKMVGWCLFTPLGLQGDDGNYHHTLDHKHHQVGAGRNAIVHWPRHRHGDKSRPPIATHELIAIFSTGIQKYKAVHCGPGRINAYATSVMKKSTHFGSAVITAKQVNHHDSRHFCPRQRSGHAHCRPIIRRFTSRLGEEHFLRKTWVFLRMEGKQSSTLT